MNQFYMQRLKREGASMAKKIEHLDDSQRFITCFDTSSCCIWYKLTGISKLWNQPVTGSFWDMA
jgi:hypothetical protein